MVDSEEDYVIGTCRTMCPLKEAQLRQKEDLLHVFEMKKGTENKLRPEFDPKKVVKSFNRSAAGSERTNPSNLRPFPVLMKTIEYLYKEIFPLHKKKPLVVYNFMFDRFRAVRQDAVIQNLGHEETIQILEPIVRFYIYFGYYLVEEDPLEYDPFINDTHLQECMKRLLVSYDECKHVDNPNRWDIESAYLLFNLGNIKPLTRGVKLCQFIVSETFRTCFKLSLQWYLKNYQRVLESIRTLPLLLVCMVNSSLPEVRRFTLEVMSHGYSSANSAYPVSHLRNLLMFETDFEVNEMCNQYGIKVIGDKINFLKKDFDISGKCMKGVRLKWLDNLLKDCDLVELLCLGRK